MDIDLFLFLTNNVTNIGGGEKSEYWRAGGCISSPRVERDFGQWNGRPVSIGAVKEEERAAFALFCLGEETRSDVGRNASLPLPCSLSRRIFSSVGDVETHGYRFARVLRVKTRYRIGWRRFSRAPSRPIFHNGCCHSRKNFRRECRRHASPKNFLRARCLGSAKWIRLGGASSGLPKRHSPLTFRFAFSPLPFLLFPRFSSLLAPADIQWWR